MVVLRPFGPGDADEATRAHEEFVGEGFSFLLDRGRAATFADYLALLDRQARGEDPLPTRVRSSLLAVELDGQLVGRVSIRYELNDHLRHEGGHIGYGVRPAWRRRGLATAILRAALERVAGEGIDPALVTCDDDNVGSAAVIERCGGRLQDRVTAADGHLMRRYLVATGATTGATTGG